MPLDRYTELFLEEANEYVEELNQNLLKLEREGYDSETIDEIFRMAHSLKSSAAFVGLDHLSNVSHKMEDLLQLIKDGNVEVSTHIINIFFQCLDRISHVINLFSQGEPSNEGFVDLIKALEEVTSAAKSPGKSAPPKAGDSVPSQNAEAANVGSSEVPVPDSNSEFIRLSDDEKSALVQESGSRHVYDGTVILDDEVQMKNVRFILLLEKLKTIGNVFKSEPDEADLENDDAVNKLHFIISSDASRADVLKICQVDMVQDIILKDHSTALESKKVKEGQEAPEETRVHTRNIKVAADKVDYLMNNVGELVITNSGLQKVYDDMSSEIGDERILAELKEKIDGATRIARDLQSGIMKMRMINVGLIFNRFTRPVRDLAHELNKEVDLSFSGEDTELDKNIIDALTDPLMHLVRNAIGHGLESPEERKAAGKNPRGSIVLNAYQAGNNIFIEIKDDGRGLNKDRILEKARERNLIGEVEPVTDDEIFELIFQPGFSTASKLTDVSGRGVGMNVVKNMTQKFNGFVRIRSEPGKGCSFVLSFPLTLAIISAIMIDVSGEDYAFPLSEVVENIKIARMDITTLEGKDIFNLRGEILPIFHLGRLMGINNSNMNEEFPVIIVSSAERKIGFIVDNLIGKKEIVIKTLDQNFHTVRGLIGACLMGDGRIVMVLDVPGLLEIATREAREVASRELSGESLKAVIEYNAGVKNIFQSLARNGRRKIAIKEKKRAPEVVERKEPAITHSTADLSATNRHVLPETSEPKEELTETSVATTSSEEERMKEATGIIEHDREDLVNKSEEILQTSEDSSITEAVTDNLPKLYEIINSGITGAGLVLSQLLGVTVEVSVPESRMVESSSLSEYLPDDNIISIWLDSEGDFQSVLLLVFDEATGFKAAGDLMGLSAAERTPENIPREDLQSVLSELTNIVGTSILNSLANKTEMNILPTVPTFLYGTTEELFEHLNDLFKKTADYRVIYISADFFRDDMELFGRLFLFVPRESLDAIMKRI